MAQKHYCICLKVDAIIVENMDIFDSYVARSTEALEQSLQMRSCTSVQWRGGWDSFKRRMKAAGAMSGLKPAMKLGEEMTVLVHGRH